MAVTTWLPVTNRSADEAAPLRGVIAIPAGSRYVYVRIDLGANAFLAGSGQQVGFRSAFGPSDAGPWTLSGPENVYPAGAQTASKAGFISLETEIPAGMTHAAAELWTFGATIRFGVSGDFR